MAELSKSYTVRPFSKPARTDLKDAFRVYMSPATLLGQRLKSGEPCLLSTVEGSAIKGLAVAWTAPEKLQDSVVQTSKTLQSLYGLKLGDKVYLERIDAKLPEAELVTVSDVSPSLDGLESPHPNEESEEKYWEWFLEYPLGRAELIAEGMVFENIDLKGRKRTFRVEQVLSATGIMHVGGHQLYKINDSSKVTISTVSECLKSLPRSLHVSSEGVGGLYPQLRLLNERLAIFNQEANDEAPKMPPYYRRRGGILLYGPSGTGKSLVLKKIASAAWKYVLHIDNSVVGRYVGESEATVRKIFKDARSNQPSVIIIDQLESLAPKTSRESGSSANIASALASELDNLEGSSVFVVAATRRPNEVDESLRTSGRFQSEIEIPIPDVNARVEILKVLQGVPVSDPHALSEQIGQRTHGYVGGDLDTLVQMAAEKARSRYLSALPALDMNGKDTLTNGIDSTRQGMEKIQESATIQVIATDYEEALLSVRPTAMREIFLESPSVRWSDIGGQEDVKQSLREVVEWPYRYPGRMKRLNLKPQRGLLLYGPPGCSKTLTAKALATEAGLNFIAVKGAELISMYVGESERAVREVFRKARAASPSIVFFDEIDSIAASRDTGGAASGLNVLTTLLNEMDGIEELRGVLVLAATNKPEILDPALMRPGRLDTILYVGPPDLRARREILTIRTRKMDVAPDVDLDRLAAETDGYSGAEIVNICERAGYAALRECEETSREEQIAAKHFEIALSRVQRQISLEMRLRYEQWTVAGSRKL